MFKPVQVAAAAAQPGQPQQSIDDSGIKRVFMVLHGYYGNLFLSKFATGHVENGEDEGITNARKIWAFGLRDFDAGTIKTALRLCQQAHPEYPPSLPQFAALCAANKPRAVFMPAQAAIGMGQELRSRYARQAREIIAKHHAKAAAMRTGHVDLPPGLDGLKIAIAVAVAAAGGDEAATLTRLDRELAPRRVAA